MPEDVSADGSAEERGADAVRGALNRARAAARARGVTPGRPGVAPRRRVAGQRPGRTSGAHPDDRDPQLVGGSIDRLVATHGWGTDVAVGGVIGRWDQIVGSEVASHCVPEAFEEGELVVRTDSTAWATQLRLLAPTVLGRLADELGAGVVRRLVVRGPAGPSWRRGPRTVTGGRGPRDTYG